MTVSTVPPPILAAPLRPEFSTSGVDACLPPYETGAAEALVDPIDGHDSAAVRSPQESEIGRMAEVPGHLMPSILRFPRAVKRGLIHPLLRAVGPKFDAAIIETNRLSDREARSMFQGAIFTLAHSLHTDDGSGISPADSLQDYLVRLRIVRLFDAMEGRLNSMWIYPFSGFDLLPSLYASRVMGIDFKIDETNLPMYGGDPRDAFIIDGAGPRFENLFRMLKHFLASAARHPGRHIALNHDVFSDVVTRTLLICDDGDRLLFLKGVDFMHLLSPTGREDDVDRARQKLVHSCTKPGELIAVWDCNPALHNLLLESGLCEAVPLGFLPNELASRVAGKTRSEGRMLVSIGSSTYDGNICFMIPEALRIYRNRG